MVDDPLVVEDSCPGRNPDSDPDRGPAPDNRAAGTQVAVAEERTGHRKCRNRTARNNTDLATRDRTRTDTHIPSKASQNLGRIPSPSLPSPNLGLPNPIRRASHCEIRRTRGIPREIPC